MPRTPTLADRALDALQLLLDLPVRLGGRVRRRRLLRRFGRVGTDFIFDPNGVFPSPGLLEVGDHVFIGPRSYISAPVRIGHRVMFGPDATILGGNHLFAVRGHSVRFLHPKGNEHVEPVIVEDEVWCGSSVVLLGGAVVGMGAVIGAGSVVTKSIPPFVVATGGPCGPIRRIFADDDLRQHVLALGYDAASAEALVRRRASELQAWGRRDLPVIDRTAQYRAARAGD